MYHNSFTREITLLIAVSTGLERLIFIYLFIYLYDDQLYNVRYMYPINISNGRLSRQ